jgi:N6-L-threonylcarbamoyladenine synthase
MRAKIDLPVRYPPLELCTDNAAMIAAAAHQRFVGGLRSDLDMDVRPMWHLTSDAYQS